MVYGEFESLLCVFSSEVDSTESLWYIAPTVACPPAPVLKLTPPSHYGIHNRQLNDLMDCSEVDSTESLWYSEHAELTPIEVF